MRLSAFPLVAVATCVAFAAACQKQEEGEVSERPPNLAPAAPSPQLGTHRDALGEVTNGYPNDHERMVHVLTNLARHSPKNDCGDWTMEQMGNAPKAPLVYTYTGNAAARYMSRHMGDLGCFQHESCCVLGNVNGNIECTGAANCNADACGKECTGGTPTGQRYNLLGFNSYSGENIARGYGSAQAVWCGWMNSDGHRQNIYSNHNELGVGLHSSGGCGLYWTQAFGSGGGAIPRIPVASAMYAPPNPQSALNLWFAANYYDSTGNAPKRAAVVVNGHCFDLTRQWGSDGNGTYEVRFTQPDDIPTGCHPYYFLFVDGDAERWTYPDQGSLYVAIGNGGTCPAPYSAGQLPADCETGMQACEEGATEPCYSGPSGTENVGECKGGYRVCKNGFWSACRQQKLPSNERCDGLDNDCDGQVDDGNPEGDGSCTNLQERGECQAGVRQCVGGGLACVPVQSPQVETCDGKDNDCDGVVDDGFPALSCGQGECFRLVASCVNGVAQTCTPGAPQPEVADGKDNDCNGLIDDGTDCRKPDGGGVGLARVCYSFPTTDEDGGVKPPQLPCKRGTQVCQADGGWSACSGEVGPEPEVCDGKDNDCDGDTDENGELGWQRCGTGQCTAWSQVCRFGMPNACTPANASAEACNGLDDNCDGVIDDGCTCREGGELNCYSGPALTQDAGVCRGGKRSCVGGQWTGCEGEVTPSTEYCDGEDNDCNGSVDDSCVPPPVDAGTDAGSSGGNPDAGAWLPPDGGDGGGGGGGCGCGASGESGAGALLWLAFAAVAWARRRRSPEVR